MTNYDIKERNPADDWTEHVNRKPRRFMEPDDDADDRAYDEMIDDEMTGDGDDG